MKETDGPIVAAVRQARAKLAEKCGYDLDKMVEQLRELEAQYPGQVKPPAPKRKPKNEH